MNQLHEGSSPARVVELGFGTSAAQSFQEIYDAHYATVARWIRYLSGPIADHEDLIQEVFVVVYRRLPDFDGRNLAGWLYRITANQVRDYQRLTWIKHIFGRKVALSTETPSLQPTPVMTLESRERQLRLEHLLGSLSSTLRATFVLFEIAGYTAEEIAEMQSATTNTVRARIYRARKKMVALLRKSRAQAERDAWEPPAWPMLDAAPPVTTLGRKQPVLKAS
jgi:RNA polymerase sigma-70 factor (ECF subfamily)